MLRFPPKKILVPFDFTEVSVAAFHQARQLAQRFDCAIEAAYVEEPRPYLEYGPVMGLFGREERRKVLRHLRSQVGPKPAALVLFGDPVITLLRLARTRRPDLIVMGTHGRKGFERYWLGSVAEALIRLSPVPVLAVRGEPAPIRSVLAPVNFTDYSEYGYQFAAGVAAAFKAELTALHVAPDPERCPNPEFRLNNMAARLSEKVARACKPRVEARTGRVLEEILKASARHDLVVLVAHRKALLKDWVLGTTAERVLRYCPSTVLSVPSPKRPFPFAAAAEREPRAAAAGAARGPFVWTV